MFLFGGNRKTSCWRVYGIINKTKVFEVFTYCVMTSHVHMIFGKHGEQRLEELFTISKKYTINKMIEAIYNNPRESEESY